MGLVWIVLALLFGLVFFVIPLKNILRYRAFPSAKGFPLLGNALELWRTPYEFNKVWNEWTTLHGTRGVCWASHWFPIVLLGNAKDAKKVLCSREHVQKGFIYKAFDEAIGTGAFNCPVAIWKKRRPYLEQAFHTKVLQSLPKVFNTCSTRLLKAIKEDQRDNGEAFNIHTYLNLCSMNLLIEGALGVPVDPLGERTGQFWNDLISNYNRGTMLAEYRMLRPWYIVWDYLWSLTPSAKEMSKAVFLLHGMFSNLLEKRRSILKGSLNNNANDNPHPNFMDLLLQRQQSNPELGLSEQEIIYELSSIFIAGHDASAKSMAFTMLFLGHHKEAQARVHKELDEVFGSEWEGFVGEEDLGKMQYLECCIKESLRLMPPVPVITRKVGSDVQLDGSTVIPEGTEVAILSYAIHRDPQAYPEPESFKPERFLPTHVESTPFRQDGANYLPFSYGPRNCLGPKFAMMEDKIALAHLLYHYDVESVGTMDEWVLHTSITLSLEGGWNVKLTPRR